MPLKPATCGALLTLAIALPGCPSEPATPTPPVLDRCGPEEEFWERRNLSEVNSEDWEGDPVLSADALTLIFSSDRPGGQGGRDLWWASRSSIEERFSDPLPINALNGPGDETGPSISADGLTLWFSATSSGTNPQNLEFYEATRPSLDGDWGEPLWLDRFSTDERVDNGITVAMEEFIWSSNRPTSEADPEYDLDLWSSVAGGEPRQLSGLSTLEDETGPALGSDGLTLLYVSDGPLSQGSLDILVSRRDDLDADWGTPEAWERINSVAEDAGPAFTWDDCGVVFGSRRAGGLGEADLWMFGTGSGQGDHL